jgi:hypothetical protein
VRARIIGALQSLFTGDYAQWPGFVREYYTDMQAQPEYRQPISPSPFQPSVFDRLKQSPEEWVKTADSAWLRHRDGFLRACQFWVTAGVDQEIPAVKRIRGCGAPDGDGKRGDNTALERRYEWAAKYLLDIPLKEIAARDRADPSTVGRIARRVLQQANWLESAKRSERGSQTANAIRA